MRRTIGGAIGKGGAMTEGRDGTADELDTAMAEDDGVLVRAEEQSELGER